VYNKKVILQYRGPLPMKEERRLMKIRFCENNKGTGKVCKKLQEKNPALNVKRKDCVKKCGPCKKAPFALVDGEVIKADSSDELYETIVAKLAK
jgi:uncharacterized protein YuzB (UPF0349 family)